MSSAVNKSFGSISCMRCDMPMKDLWGKSSFRLSTNWTLQYFCNQGKLFLSDNWDIIFPRCWSRIDNGPSYHKSISFYVFQVFSGPWMQISTFSTVAKTPLELRLRPWQPSNSRGVRCKTPLELRNFFKQKSTGINVHPIPTINWSDRLNIM